MIETDELRLLRHRRAASRAPWLRRSRRRRQSPWRPHRGSVRCARACDSRPTRGWIRGPRASWCPATLAFVRSWPARCGRTATGSCSVQRSSIPRTAVWSPGSARTRRQDPAFPSTRAAWPGGCNYWWQKWCRISPRPPVSWSRSRRCRCRRCSGIRRPLRYSRGMSPHHNRSTTRPQRGLRRLEPMASAIHCGVASTWAGEYAARAHRALGDLDGAIRVLEPIETQRADAIIAAWTVDDWLRARVLLAETYRDAGRPADFESGRDRRPPSPRDGRAWPSASRPARRTVIGYARGRQRIRGRRRRTAARRRFAPHAASLRSASYLIRGHPGSRAWPRTHPEGSLPFRRSAAMAAPRPDQARRVRRVTQRARAVTLVRVGGIFPHRETGPPVFRCTSRHC